MLLEICSFQVNFTVKLDSQVRVNVGGLGTGGGTHIFGRTGMCRSNGSLFYKKSLNMGPVFYQKILKHGSTFLTEPKFSGFSHSENPENREIFENWTNFSRKILKNGYPFLPKSPLKWVGVLRLERHTPVQLNFWVPPGDLATEVKISVWWLSVDWNFHYILMD